MPTEITHFTVSGEFITNHARNLVIEGSWEKAIRFLVDSIHGFTYDYAIAILSGKQKLTGNSSDDSIALEDEIGEIENEELKTYLNTLEYQYNDYYSERDKWWRPYAWVSNYGRADLAVFKEDRADSKLSDTGGSLLDSRNWSLRARYYMNDKQHDLLKYAKIDDEGERPILLEERKSPPIWLNLKNTIQTVIDNVKHLEERGHHQWFPHEYDEDHKYRFKTKKEEVIEKEFAPTPDTQLEHECGWILPNGDFYGCEHAGHIYLVDKIFRLVLKEEHSNAEKKAEDGGWLKIGTSCFVDERFYFAFSTITQSQMNTLFEWCKKHEVKYPSERIELLEQRHPRDPLYIEAESSTKKSKT